MTAVDFSEKYGPWAFVAGASTGTGLALSEELASRGLNLVMLARNGERLDRAADDVRSRYHVEVRTVAADLASTDIGDIAMKASAGLTIGLLIYNATVPMFGRFLDCALDLHDDSIAVNCRTPVVLSHLFAGPMVERRRGGIGIVGSNAATQGAMNFSTYNAGKAFEWILAESLWVELGRKDVDVCTVLSGPIASPAFMEYQKTLDPALRSLCDSADVLDRYRARLLDPCQPQEVALALLDGLGQAPVVYAHPVDEEMSRACLALPRPEAIALQGAMPAPKIVAGLVESSQGREERPTT